MPIRREFRRYYGARWRRERLVALAQADYRCALCGREHRLLNWAHVEHDPRSPRRAVLCPSCHARHDAKQRWARTRRTRARRAGQVWLSKEIELAPEPLWLWPASLLQLSFDFE